MIREGACGPQSEEKASIGTAVSKDVTGNMVRRGLWSGGPNSLENPVRGTVFPNLVLQKLWSGYGEIGPASKSD